MLTSDQHDQIIYIIHIVIELSIQTIPTFG